MFSAIGRLLVDEYLKDNVDRIYIAYTKFESMMHQVPVIRKLLPLDIKYKEKSKEGDSLNATHQSEQGIYL